MPKKILWDVFIKEGERYVKELDVNAICEHYLMRLKESNETALLWKAKCEATQKELADAEAECELNYVDWGAVAVEMERLNSSPKLEKVKIKTPKVTPPKPEKVKKKTPKETPIKKVKKIETPKVVKVKNALF